MTARFQLEQLFRSRSVHLFGVEPLDRYLRRQASQDVKRKLSAGYVATERTTGRLAGYYTLSAASIALADVPLALQRKLPRYPTVPAARIGRLAVDQAFQGQVSERLCSTMPSRGSWRPEWVCSRPWLTRRTTTPCAFTNTMDSCSWGAGAHVVPAAGVTQSVSCAGDGSRGPPTVSGRLPVEAHHRPSALELAGRPTAGPSRLTA